jgi:hypothetical protein
MQPFLQPNSILGCLHDQQESLQKRFNVKAIAVFGSVARDEARAESDVDILVDFF